MRRWLAISLVWGAVLAWAGVAAAQIQIDVGGFPGVSVRVGPGVAVSVAGIGVSVGGGGYGYYPGPCANGYPYAYRAPSEGYSGGYYTGYGTVPATTEPPGVVGDNLRATIVNPAENHATLAFQVDGRAHTLSAGKQQEMTAGPGAEIVFDRGGGAGAVRYSLHGGTYAFAPTASGWELFRQAAEQVPAPAAESAQRL